MVLLRRSLVVLSPLLLAACDAPKPASRAAPALVFQEISALAGLRFRNVCGGPDKDYIVETNGAGVALLDYDRDGDLDVFLVNGAVLSPPFGAGLPADSPPPSDSLFRNDGGLRFTDVTRAVGIVESDWGCGAVAADYDNDGDPDLYVTNYGPDRLWRNDGSGFVDVTKEAGVGDPGWGSSAAWLDYDRDGLLDLMVVNYLEFDAAKVKKRGSGDPSCVFKGQPILCGPIGLPPGQRTLYRNLGGGKFADVSATIGIRSAPPSYGLGVIALDYNNDDWPDIYVTNDSRPNLLFESQAGKGFVEVAMRAGCALNELGRTQAGMGVDATFRSKSGFEDLFVVVYEDDTNTYFQNDGQGFFTERTGPLGLAEPCFKYLGWSCFFFDADLDGDEDLFVGQGHVVPQADKIPSSPGYKQPSKLFLAEPNGKFLDASERSGPALTQKKSLRGAAYGDLDGDGDADIVANAIDDQASLIENSGPPHGHWLAVRTIGTKSNRDGIGAVVTLTSGGAGQQRRIRSGSSFASSSEPFARFGLGSATQVDALTVRWPTGSEERYEVLAVDRVLIVEEGKGAVRG